MTLGKASICSSIFYFTYLLKKSWKEEVRECFWQWSCQKQCHILSHLEFAFWSLFEVRDKKWSCQENLNSDL